MTGKSYYECHVTFLYPGYMDPKLFFGWKFSQINGDPVLGDGIKSYLTKHFNDKTNSLESVINEVEHIATSLKIVGFKVLRTKVEHVVYDSKTFILPE